MNLQNLPLSNLKYHAGRTAGLIALVALLAFTMLAGSLIMASLSNGMKSLEARMGADVIVAPKSAKSTTNLEDVLIEGVPGSFYMDKSVVDQVAQVPGVEKVSPQYYLATAKSGCCSFPIQIIGFDSETDFTIQPWVARSYKDTLGEKDVIVGSEITSAVGDTLTFYGVEVSVVAKLDRTGTSLDHAVFSNAKTIADFIEGSRQQGISVLAEGDPERMVSTVQVKVSDDARIQDVVDYINLYVKDATAVQAKTMTTSIADSMAGVSKVITVMAVVIWVLAAAVLVVAFSVVGKHRSKEFAILRVLGASKKDVVRVVSQESLLIGFAGAVIGCCVALIMVAAFSNALQSALGLPFLLPDVGVMALLLAVAFAVAVLAGPLASAYSARALSKVDAGNMLREE